MQSKDDAEEADDFPGLNCQLACLGLALKQVPGRFSRLSTGVVCLGLAQRVVTQCSVPHNAGRLSNPATLAPILVTILHKS